MRTVSVARLAGLGWRTRRKDQQTRACQTKSDKTRTHHTHPPHRLVPQRGARCNVQREGQGSARSRLSSKTPVYRIAVPVHKLNNKAWPAEHKLYLFSPVHLGTKMQHRSKLKALTKEPTLVPAAHKPALTHPPTQMSIIGAHFAT